MRNSIIFKFKFHAQVHSDEYIWVLNLHSVKRFRDLADDSTSDCASTFATIRV